MPDAFTQVDNMVMREGRLVIADAITADVAGIIVDALNHCPLQSYARAQAIGERLCARWKAMTGKEPPLAQDDLAWPDMVQFIVRMAREPGELPRITSDQPSPPGERAKYNEGDE